MRFPFPYLVLLAAAIVPRAAHADIVFSNLLPSPTFQYYNGGGLLIGSSSPFGYQGLVQAFQPAESGWLQELDLGVNYDSADADQVSLKLEGNVPDSHLPDDNVLASGLITPPVQPTATPSPLIAFTPGAPVYLDAESTYWVIVLPSDDATSDVWDGIQSFGWTGFTKDGANFTTENEQGYALQVQATPAPEANVGSLLAVTGLILLLGTGRGRARLAQSSASR